MSMCYKISRVLIGHELKDNNGSWPHNVPSSFGLQTLAVVNMAT
jgi:hypothetical protein